MAEQTKLLEDFSDRLDEISRDVKSCTECRLHEERRHAVPGEGDHEAKIMFIGEAPGKQEDEAGRPFVGRAGALLEELLKEAGFSREDVFITNVVKCRPPDNRDPRKDEIETCKPYLEEQIDLLEPKLIVTLGNHAAETLIGRSGMKDMHGQEFEYKGVKVIPMYHPAAGLYNPDLKSTMKEDMKNL